MMIIPHPARHALGRIVSFQPGAKAAGASLEILAAMVTVAQPQDVASNERSLDPQLKGSVAAPACWLAAPADFRD